MNNFAYTQFFLFLSVCLPSFVLAFPKRSSHHSHGHTHMLACMCRCFVSSFHDDRERGSCYRQIKHVICTSTNTCVCTQTHTHTCDCRNSENIENAFGIFSANGKISILSGRSVSESDYTIWDDDIFPCNSLLFLFWKYDVRSMLNLNVKNKHRKHFTQSWKLKIELLGWQLYRKQIVCSLFGSMNYHPHNRMLFVCYFGREQNKIKQYLLLYSVITFASTNKSNSNLQRYTRLDKAGLAGYAIEASAPAK